LTADSEITVEELRMVKDGNETADGMRKRTARIQLNRGRILVLVGEPGAGDLQVIVAAHNVTVSPDSACLFSVSTDGASTRVTCARDEVSAFVAPDAPVTIAAGYFQQWPAGNRKPLMAAQNAAAQVDVMESMDAGERLLDEAVGLQNRRPF
jgi:ferric-dicitrate binding protein FerR (iron transport regulator)